MNYRFIGWCREGFSDKVWVVIQLPVGNLVVWGRRGKKLQHQMSELDEWNLDKLVRTKVNKGYKSIVSEELNTVYPEFEDDLKRTAFWAALSA